jgi:endonuclease/exonuclease/phosphatase family metal-dependent hydrolase
MCLQECSNVLVNFLKEKLKDIYTLFADEIEEDVFMVTITSKYMGFQKEEIPDNKYEEIAYGYLVLKNQDLTVINVHLRPQFTVKNKNILTTIKNDVIGKKCIIAGDFNERSKNIINYLSTFMVPYFGITYKEKKGIDHIVYNFPVVNGISKVLDTYSVSDHCAISLILEF